MCIFLGMGSIDFISLPKRSSVTKVLTLTDLGQASHFSDEEAESHRKVELELMADPDYNKGFGEFRDIFFCSV